MLSHDRRRIVHFSAPAVVECEATDGALAAGPARKNKQECSARDLCSMLVPGSHTRYLPSKWLPK